MTREEKLEGHEERRAGDLLVHLLVYLLDCSVARKRREEKQREVKKSEETQRADTSNIEDRRRNSLRVAPACLLACLLACSFASENQRRQVKRREEKRREEKRSEEKRREERSKEQKRQSIKLFACLEAWQEEKRKQTRRERR